MSQASGIYLIGLVVAVTGLAWLAHLAGIPGPWIGATVVVVIGLGIVGVAKRFGNPPSGGSGGPGDRR